jgi:8-oxo-dGTP diphosphatase
VSLVRAAGGLVGRFDDAGHFQVLLVHRSRYDDWSFPKGKLDEGESFEEAALREVAEETGLICRLDGELAPVRYFDSAGRPKLVRYWRMIPIEGDIRDFVFNAEIDDLRWVGADEADSLLSYQHDRELLIPWREAGLEPRQSLKPPIGRGESSGSGS